MTLVASINVLADDRILAYFHVDIAVGNFLAFLVERKGTGMILGRTRLYRDNLIGPKSKDEHTCYEAAVPDGTPEESIAGLRRLCDAICKATDEGSLGPAAYTFHVFKTGTWQEVAGVLALDESMHVTTAVPT